MLTPEQAVLASMFTCFAGAGITLAVARSKVLAGWFSFAATTGTAILIIPSVVRVLAIGPSAHPETFLTLPKLGLVLRFYVDGLTSLFLLLAVLVAVPASLYSILYMRHYRDYGVAGFYPSFLLFLAAIYGLLSTTDMMWVFFIFWQLMTLPGYALVRFEHRKPENVWAAKKYLFMMEVACAATMAGAKLLAIGSQSPNNGAFLKYDFDTLSANLPVLLSTRPGIASLAFGLFLVGFGIKMGMWPFGQVWLPDAHPAAPSPVSAMFSGVMIKTGIYGLIRYFLWLVPDGAQRDFPLGRWGLVVSILGTVTLFVGTMQALKQEQSKRLLAFSSIGQIGYMLLGIGACMALLAVNTTATAALATIALMGALFHLLNHGIFKGLLFLNAGSMFYATGTQDLNQMGGLMKFMPVTALTALVASFSISGVPLLNGFVSKWTIWVAAIQGSRSAHYLAVCAVIAILTSALTLATFIKFFGVSFLSRTSTLVDTRAKERASDGTLEVPWMMRFPQLALASICILLGIVPSIGFQLLQHALRASPGGIATALTNGSPMASSVPAGLWQWNSAAVFAPLALAAVLAVTFLVAYALSKAGGAARRNAEPWLCGYARDAECNRYVAHNFYGEIKRYFRWLGGMPTTRKSALLKDRPLETR